jgi:hypothetical protein
MAVIMDKKLKLANVELHLPPDDIMVSPLRLLVSGLASRLGFSMDEIEDLKLTVGEAFLAVVEKCHGLQGQIAVRWNETPESLTVRITDPSHTFSKVYNEPILHLLEKIADEITVGEPDADIRLRFDYEGRRKQIFKD